MATTPYPQTDRELIRRIERSAGHRAGYKQLVRELGLGGGRERRLLLEQLARITARGELVKTEQEQWALPAGGLREDGASDHSRAKMLRVSGAPRVVARNARPAAWRAGSICIAMAMALCGPMAAPTATTICLFRRMN